MFVLWYRSRSDISKLFMKRPKARFQHLTKLEIALVTIMVFYYKLFQEEDDIKNVIIL